MASRSPCCNGEWFKRRTLEENPKSPEVVVLVVMESGLKGQQYTVY